MTARITLPVANNRTKISNFMRSEDDNATYIVVSVIADQPLILNVNQAYDEDFFDTQEAQQYSDLNNETTFRFTKVGTIAYFTLTNTSGTDCTYTRAFADYRNDYPETATSAQQVSDATTHTELQSLGLQVTSVNDDLKQCIQQSFNKYNFYGRNNEVALNAGGALIYADTVPPPIRSPDYREGWLYFNDNAGNKFNYYYFSNTAFLVPANEIVGQFCVFENLVPTLENVNVLFNIYAGTNFLTDGRRVYTSNVRIKPGVKYLAYWGQDPGVFPALPRLEYTLASERNWNGELNVLNMSVGSDSGYAAQTVGNLMTHVGYVDSEGAVTSSLIGSTDNINSGAQILKATKDASDILATTGNDVVQIRDRLESGNAFQTNDAVAISVLGDILGSSESILTFLQTETVNAEDTAVRNELQTVNNTLVLLGQKLDEVNTNLTTLINQGNGA